MLRRGVPTKGLQTALLLALAWDWRIDMPLGQLALQRRSAAMLQARAGAQLMHSAGHNSAPKLLSMYITNTPWLQAEDLGPVKDGLLVSCSTAQARRLRAEPPAAVLTALGKRFQFEARLEHPIGGCACGTASAPPLTQREVVQAQGVV